MTLFFRVNEDAAAELVALNAHSEFERGDLPVLEAEPALSGESTNDEALQALVIEKADEVIEDRLARLTWEQMQDLVAGSSA